MESDRNIFQGIAVFDVDDTLVDTTGKVLEALFRSDLKIASAVVGAVKEYVKSRVKLITEEEFLAEASKLYASILHENGPEKMTQFYQSMTQDIERYNHGAISLIQACIRNDILTVFISGGHDQFVKMLLQENGIDHAHQGIRVFASEFEQDEKGRFTGQTLRSNMGAKAKKDAVDQIMKEYPDVPILCASGDSNQDLPLLDSVQDKGLRIVTVESGFLQILKQLALYPGLIHTLQEQGFAIFTDITGYQKSPNPKKILCVRKKKSPGHATFQDAVGHLPQLLSL